ncbi:hypothetical protein LF1_53710 [Rubripirellula obstinata]|uniref:Uncharacterized protein n=1 Tax=Rubripirellula obstinata TaxID=406547 RepID=A0A5B1CAC0_9BACT|nr:hypothetical protein [Rubripirellula obstinata]KAA1257222.1 hypothetical protein LF1_53710 [Rubripirellula obstinata]
MKPFAIAGIALLTLTVTPDLCSQGPNPIPLPKAEQLKRQLTLERQRMLSALAEINYKDKTNSYLAGITGISSVLDAATAILRQGLSDGASESAKDYDRRIEKLEEMIASRVSTGLSTKAELATVQAARLDQLLKRLLDTHHGVLNHG